VSPRVAVIGGSLAGPATALFLQKSGVEVDLYESTPEGVQLAGGVIGIDHVTLDALERAGVSQDEIVSLGSEQVVVARVLDRSVAGQVRTFYPGRTTTWTQLHTALRNHLNGVRFHGNKRVVDVRASERGPATLLFADGTDATADLIVFADGRRSTGRKLLDPTRKLSFAGYVAHRGARPGYPSDFSEAYTRFDQLGASLHTFPVITSSGELSTDWTFYLNSTATLFKQHFGGAPTVRTFVFPKDITPDAVTYVNQHARQQLPELEAHIVETTTSRHAAPVVDIDPPTRMVFPLGRDARAILLGDALAPPRPNTASGANTGIQQGDGLAIALRQHSRWHANLDAALEALEERSLPTVARMLQLGRERGARLGLGVHA
jgi:2-polyprenyl-6-methoxyphenol hydroxylase-like FAD-dependent oxidoreductase